MGKRILIAEDELLVALSIRKRIEKKGYTVCAISKTGQDTITQSMQKDPDLLIVDIFLEDNIDGIDAVTEIHKCKQIPVIFTTASTDFITRERADKISMIEFLIKPYNYDILLNIIEENLGQASI